MKTNFLNIHDMVLILTIVECIFLAALLKVLPAKRPQPRHLLALFFLFIAIRLLATLVVWNVDLQTLNINHSTLTPLLLASSSLLQGPALYFYLRSLSENIHLFNWKNMIHLAPIFITVLTIVVFDIDGQDWLPWAALPPPDKIAMKFIWALVHCSPLLYILGCFYLEYQSRKKLQQLYSAISSIELQLADVVLTGFFIHWLWALFEYFAGGYLSPSLNDWMGIANNYLVVLQVNGLFIFGLLNTRQLLNTPIYIPKIDTSSKITLLNNEKIQIIENAIHTQKLYLENSINLERFAELINLKPRDLSVIINSHYNLNFFEFINGLRIEEAKRLLASAEHTQDTILDIIYKSGFNSQSSFQRFFNRLVGVTPSEYRRQVLSNKAP